MISDPEYFFFRLVGSGSGRSATGSAPLQESQQERPLVELTEPTYDDMVLEPPQLSNPTHDGYNGVHDVTVPDDVANLVEVEAGMVKPAQGLLKQQSALSSSVAGAGVPNLKLSVNDMIEVGGKTHLDIMYSVHMRLVT